MTTGNSGNRFTPEIRARAVGMVLENEGDYPNGQLAIFHGPRKLASYKPDGTEIKDVKQQAA